MNKHRSRLVAVGLLAALGLTFFIHVLATSDNEQGGSWGVDANGQKGYFEYIPDVGEGDHFRINWEWAMQSFRPVFSGGDFYVVEGGAEFPFHESNHKILYHGQDNRADCCGPNSILELQRKPGQGPLSLVWVLDYDAAWRPTGAQTNNDVLGQPMTGDTAAQERELRYVRAFLNEAGGGLLGPPSPLDIAHESVLSRHLTFILLEGVMAAGSLVFWGLSLAPQSAGQGEGEAGRLVGLIQRGRDYLRAQLRLQLLVGPLLITAGFFGTEAIDNGGLGFYDPTGFYANWIAGSLVGLWLLVVGIWIVGLVRVLRSLRHYNKTPEPDLGVPVA